MARSQEDSQKGIALSGNKCIVCDWCEKSSLTGNSLIEGAHVRPYSTGSEYDSYDNIIALCPNHHTEYDSYNFYIDPDSRVLHFRDCNSIFDGKDVSDRVAHIKKKYLAYGKYLYENKVNK